MKSITALLLKVVLILAVVGLSPPILSAFEDIESHNEKEATDFTQFSLEELKDVVIVSVSKKPETVSNVAAAVYVITQEDIRRSGVTSIPEALRLAPGVHVARITATEWAINIRGLNDQFAQNLLVMIDGRKVYTHVFSGVFWDVQDTVVEDIDRIEVVRGPGAALWGANAVNGVINIITKSTEHTKGTQAVAILGNEEQSGSVRYGSTFGNGTHYRLFGKFFNRGDLSDVNLDNLDEAPDQNNAQSSDNWRSGRSGFRIDMEPGMGLPSSSQNAFILQGEAYTNRYEKEFERRSLIFPSAQNTQTDETETTSKATGWHLMGRWQHTITADSETILQIYYDHTQKDYDPGSGKVHTTNVDFQHRLPGGESHDIVWGLEYSYVADEFDDSDNIRMVPSDMDQDQWSAFIQDEFTIIPNLVTFIAGSKFEHNEFTGLEVQPSIRAMYTPDDHWSLWSALSRAVRVPSRLELHGRTSDSLSLDAANPDERVEVTTKGNRNLQSEELTALEFGARLKPTRNIWMDTTLFFNDYHNLIGLELANTNDNAIELGYANNRSGQAYGLELVLDWKLAKRWIMGGSYTYLHTLIEDNKVNDPNIEALISRDSNPRHLFALRSNLDLTRTIDFDLWFRYVGRLPERDIDGYSVLDARIGWQFNPDLELSLVGQNLLESEHSEFSSLEVERSIYAKIDWKF